MLFRFRAFAESLLVPWFPAVCARCSAEGCSPCVSCSEAFSPAHELGDISDLDAVVGLVAYDEVSRPFIADLKYRGKWATARAFAPALAILLDDCIGGERPGPVLTWAPTTPERVRHRGFDQAEVIAREVGRYAGRPVRQLLDRQPGLQQTGRSRRERSQGIIFRPRTEVSGAVIVFDDVVTTGATLSAAGRALQDAGASAVVGVALAATPEPPKG
jgi:predicted amidophosphoribosyltransferase